MLLPQAHLHAHAVGPGPGPELKMTVETTGPDETFTLPCANYLTYDAQINWGDGQQSTITAHNDPDLTHTYANAGSHNIEITGDLPWIYFNNGGDRLKLTEITQWGDGVVQKFQSSFKGCSNLHISAPDALIAVDPTFSSVFDLVGLITSTGNWDLSAINNGYIAFYRLYDRGHIFDTSAWVLNALSDARYFFYGLRNSPLDVSGWGLANLSRAEYMFWDNNALDSDMGSLNLSSLTNTTGMFDGCVGMSQPNVDSLLSALYTHRMAVTWATPAMDLSDMATPSGIYQYANPPTTGLEYAYWLENDPDAEGFNTWTLTI